MKKNQSEGDGPLHQTVAVGFEFKSGERSIAVEFTDQQLSAHAGTATFWAWLHSKRWAERLAAALPHRLPESNNSLTPREKALAFVHGLLGEARKLTHVAYFRRDPLVPELLGTYNLSVLFQRHLGWQTKVTIHSLRFWLFRSPGIIAHPAGKTTIKLAVPLRERDWWSRLWEKILSPFPNCNAVENRPAFTG